ncbi:MAG TPA: hypothetical protein PK819_03200 [Thermomicrobiales bacterium]|nr:hypothetical protein [Thermomicrobiales bacterium]
MHLLYCLLHGEQSWSVDDRLQCDLVRLAILAPLDDAELILARRIANRGPNQEAIQLGFG